MADLNPQQERFCEEYLLDLNGKQAAIRAGYSAGTAEVQASRLLSQAKVQGRVAELKAARSERVAVDADMVLRQWVEIATADPNELIQYRRCPCEACYPEDDKAAGNPAMEPSGDCAKCFGEGVADVFIPDTRHLRGPARRLYAGVKVTKEGLQVQMRDQDGALAKIADHLGMLRKVQVSGPNGGPIETHELTKRVAALPRDKRDLLRATIKAALEGGEGESA